MAGKPNWRKIKMEYITGDISYRDIAAKYNVPVRTLTDRARAEGWFKLRREYRDKVVAKACDKAAERTSDQIAELVTDAAQMLLDRARAAIGQLGKPVRGHKEVVEDGCITTTTQWETLDEEPGAVNPKAVRELASALKDIGQVLGLKTELDRREQEARINKLRREAERDEDAGRGIEVVFAAGPEEWSE